MKQYEEVFFSVLRTALWGHPLDIPEGFKDWGKVMKLAKTQALTGLVGDVMLTTPRILNSLPEQAVAVLQEIPLNNMAMHTTLNNTLILVVTTLREHGIEPVLLKGQGIASYYPVPQLRQCGDIDLYVGEENYEKAYDVLLPLVSEIDQREAIWTEIKHFHCKIGSVLLEVHRFSDVNFSSRLNKIYQKYSAEGLNNNLVPVDFCGTQVLTPSDDFNLYYIFNHLWHHFMASGIGLRHLCDLAVFLNTHEVNKQYLSRILTEMKAMKPWQSIGAILVQYLGLPQERMPFYAPLSERKAKVIFDRIFAEGNFGHYSIAVRHRTGFYMWEKAVSLANHIKRHLLLLTVFPSQSVMQIRYTLKSGFRQVFKDLKAKLRK